MIIPGYNTPVNTIGFIAMWKWIRGGLSKEEWESLYLNQALNTAFDGDDVTRHNTSLETIEGTREETERKKKPFRWN